MQSILKRSDAPRAGMTLIEMMVVLALTLFIMVLFTTLFVQATDGMNTARGISTVEQKLRLAVTLIRKDLGDVVLQGTTSPATAFTTVSDRPTGGYFLYEENSPANHHGVDRWGLPVVVDTDDVLAFTAQRAGTGPDEVFYGAVSYDPANDPPAVSAAGEYLDNYGNPRGRFDERGNGATTTRVAEVVYFLRPDRQYALDEVRGHDGTTPTDLTGTVTAPPTYTLYRRQLLVLDQSVIDDSPLEGTVPIDRYYQRFALSAKPDPSAPTMMRFNHLGILDERRNRFGLYHDPADTGADHPFSWVTASGTSADSDSIFDIDVMGATWIGRPLGVETNLNAADFFADVQTELTSGGDEDRDGILGKASDGSSGSLANFDDVNLAWNDDESITYRYGEDVFLENVLSFDVRVYDADFRSEPERPEVDLPPKAKAKGIKRTRIVGPPTTVVNPKRRIDDTQTALLDQRGHEFVDLGYRGDEDEVELFDVVMGGVPIQTDSIDDLYIQQGEAYSFEDYDPLDPPARWRNVGRLVPSDPTGPGVADYAPRRTYDTWSSDYRRDPHDSGTARLRPVPYPKPLKAIQIKIRVVDPKSGVVRETTIIHKFDE